MELVYQQYLPIMVWVVFILFKIFARFIVSNFYFHVELLQIVKIRCPPLFQKLEISLSSVNFICKYI